MYIHFYHKCIYIFTRKKKITKSRKLVCVTNEKRKICCSYKIYTTSIKSWISTKKSTQSNSI